MDTEAKNKIGVTSAPNTTETIKLHILAKERDNALEGNLVTITINRNGTELLILAQITSLVTNNKWHEKDEYASVITTRGSLPFMSEKADVTSGEAAVVGAYKRVSGKWVQMPLAIPIGTGLEVVVATPGLIRAIVADTCTGNSFYVGRAYGTDNVYAPLDLRHYGKDAQGHGEAYMGGIFGPSGSGKSVMTATMLAGFSRNKDMGILLVDPQGEFRADKMKKPGFDFSFHEMLTKCSEGKFIVKEHALGLSNLLIRDVPLFIEVLRHNGFLQPMLKGSNKTPQAYENLEEYAANTLKLTEKGAALRWEAIQIANPSFFDDLAILCARTYTKEEERQEDLRKKLTANRVEMGVRWNDAVSMFENDGTKKDVAHIIEEVLTKGKIYILDVSPENGDNDDTYKRIVLKYIMSKLKQVATILFKASSGATTNALIVLDEAHLFAGGGHEEGSVANDLSTELSRAIAMMRKLNCGILLSTQFISQLRKDIFRQLHYRIYATGLIGSDKLMMEEKEGGESVELYEKLPQPQKSKRYCYMVGGNIGCLGTTGRPLIIEGFKDGAPGIYRENGITHGSIAGLLKVFGTE
jgi:hypothetical protein